MNWKDKTWHPGMQIRLIHNPLKVGMLTDAEPRIRRNRRQFQIRFPDGVKRIPEDQFEPLPEERMNPLDLLIDGKLGTPEDLRRTLAHVRLTGHLADIIYSMEATNTDFYAYQFKPILKLLQSPTNSLLIADEVGLGKTIEAGLIWTELRSRFNLKRMVVLCPAALREKWRDELTQKMGLSPLICDAKEMLRILEDDISHAKGFVIISSMQGLRPPRGWQEKDGQDGNTAKLAHYLQMMESEERLIDLLVVDEAHHMRNSESQTNSLGQLMRRVAEYLVFLTATPIHNYNRDLFSLLHLLDPETFERHENLDDILNANAPLVKARDLVLRGTVSGDELQSILIEAQSNHLLQDNRQLESLLKHLSGNSLSSLTDRSHIAHRLETVNLLGHTITRTRKRDVKEWRVVREPQPEFIPMTSIEQEFYSAVTSIIINYSINRGISEAFLLSTPQRQMTSCMPAALKSWKERKIEIPADEYSGSNEDEKRRQHLGPLTSGLVDRSDEFVDVEELVQHDSKYARLQKRLKEFFKAHQKEKVIIFSTFKGTLAYLKNRLSGEGISCIVLQGGGARPKTEIIEEFKSKNGPQVLLSTEVGGEGVDLQFCWVLINYDLPWNPMRVEQRIGRIDRIGQNSDKVLIWNLFYDNTIDARIHERLYDKLDLCRNALGDFEAILGEEINKLTHDLLTEHLTPEQQNQRISQTAQALETLRLEEQQLEAEAAHLVAHGDYILQQVQAARDMNRWINGEDLYRYVTDFLNIHYPGYVLSQSGNDENNYQLELPTICKHDLSEFIHLNNLHGQTRLGQETGSVMCKFENKVFSGKRLQQEIISQFHPLVRFISAKISETAKQTRPAVSVRVSKSMLTREQQEGTYAVAISLWSLQGVRDVEKLVYEACNIDDPKSLLGEDEAESLAASCANNGELWLEATQTTDISQVHDIINDHLFGSIEDKFNMFVEEESAKNEDRADIQERNLNKHVKKQRETIENTIMKFRADGKTKLIPATEGRLRALNDRTERRKLAINEQRKVTDNTEDICLILALVE